MFQSARYLKTLSISDFIMKRGFSASTASLSSQSGAMESAIDCKENLAPTASNSGVIEEIGLHFSYKSSQRPRLTSSRKGRATRNRAEVMKESENIPTEPSSKNKPTKSQKINLHKVPKQTRQTKLNFSSPSTRDFPTLPANSAANNVVQPPSGSWAKRAVQNPSGVRSPVTSSPLAKVAKASQSSFRKLNLPGESPLASSRSSLRKPQTSSPEPNKLNTKLFGKAGDGDAAKAPNDYELNFHKFASDSWADMMDEVDSIKSGNRSFVSIDTSLNTTMDSVESGDLEGLLQRRSKQIAFGKNTKEYQFYIKTVAYDKRKQGDPVTPIKEETFSRRAWDGKVQAWKRQIKIWAAPKMGGGESSKTSAETSLSKILDSLPVAEKLNPKSPYKKTLTSMGLTTPTKKKESHMEGITTNVDAGTSKSPFKRPRDVDMDIVMESPSKRRTTVAPARSICTRSLAAAMNEDSLLNDEDLLGSKRVVSSSARVDESSCSTLVDESSCMSTDGAWTVKRMPMPANVPPQLDAFLRNCSQK